MDTISFKRHRFPPEIIRRAVWLYARFTLSYRDVGDLLAERGLDISYESVRRWFLKFGAPIARNLRPTRPIPNGYWHLDEMVIVIRGQRYWLWRAVDNEGEVLDFLVQSKRTGLLTVCYRWTMSSSRRSFIQTTMAASGSAR